MPIGIQVPIHPSFGLLAQHGCRLIEYYQLWTVCPSLGHSYGSSWLGLVNSHLLIRYRPSTRLRMGFQRKLEDDRCLCMLGSSYVSANVGNRLSTTFVRDGPHPTWDESPHPPTTPPAMLLLARFDVGFPGSGAGTLRSQISLHILLGTSWR